MPNSIILRKYGKSTLKVIKENPSFSGENEARQVSSGCVPAEAAGITWSALR